MLASELFHAGLVFNIGLETAAPLGRAILAPHCGKSLEKENIAAFKGRPDE